MIRKSKRFPFFALPEPKRLTRSLKKVEDFVVLVRVTPEINIFNYIHSSLFLVYFSICLIAITCTCLVLFFTKAPGILFTFLLHYGWAMLTSTYTGYKLPAKLQNYEIAFWGIVACLGGFLWIAMQSKSAAREFHGLLKMHTMTQTERKKFALDRFLHFSLPFWLHPSVSYDPTPEELLKVLREREQATEQKTQDIAATLDEEEEEPTPDLATIPDDAERAPLQEGEEEQAQEDEQEEQPSISMLLTLTHNASMSLLAPGNKQVTMELKGAVVSLVAYLAIHARGCWVTKEELFKQVYDPGKESAFAMHRSRANSQVIRSAREAGIFPIKARVKAKGNIPQSLDTSEPPQCPFPTEENGDVAATGAQVPSEGDSKAEIELFKNQMQGQVSSWQFTSACNVEIFPFLTDFYRKLVTAQSLPRLETSDALSLEQLRQGCHHVMEEYKEGFLASYMKKGYIWSWALSLYQKYREQCLFILAYANQREREYLEICQTRGEKYDVVEHIAQLYGWQAAVAVGLDIKDGGISSEKDMERCLNYYSKVKKKSAARATYQRYCELRSRLDPTYEPSEALNACAKKVLSSKGKADRSRPSEKEAS